MGTSGRSLWDFRVQDAGRIPLFKSNDDLQWGFLALDPGLSSPGSDVPVTGSSVVITNHFIPGPVCMRDQFKVMQDANSR